MKTKKCVAILLVLFAMTFLFSSCNSEPQTAADFLSTASNVYVNSVSSSVFSFNVALFSKKKIKKVDYIGLECENSNSDDYIVTITDNNIDVLNSYKYKGLYIKNICVDITTTNDDVENCRFEELLLNIDGVRRSISFSKTINNLFAEENGFTEELHISVFPNEFSSSIINNDQESATYEFYATKDVILTGIHFNDFLSASNVYYSIDDEDSHNAEFPISINAGETIRLSISFASDSVNELSYVTTNIYFDYLTKTDNKKHFNSMPIVFDPIYPIIENDCARINKIVDSLI